MADPTLRATRPIAGRHPAAARFLPGWPVGDAAPRLRALRPGRAAAARSSRPRLIVSAVLHAAVLILAIGVIHETPPLEPAPEQGVAVVFESGSRQGSPTPSKAHPERRPSAPPQTSATARQTPTPTRPPNPEAAPVTPPAPGPLALQTAPPARTAPTLPQALAVPAPVAPSVPGPLALQTTPPLPIAPAVPQTLTAPPLPVPPLPVPAPRTPGSTVQPRGRTGRPAFPAPMDLSLARPSPGARAAPRSRGLDLSMGPVVQGGRIVAPYASFDAKAAGTDWTGALMAWVDRHKYYPQRAALAGEDGSATVRVTMLHDGRVQSVELETTSGSEWLDIATLGMFRDALLPALPAGMQQRDFTFHFTMHYVLARGPG